MLEGVSLHDMEMMFLDTLLMYKDSPIRVDGIIHQRNNNFEFKIFYFDGQYWEFVPFNLVDFDIRPLKIGYLNVGAGTCYCRRVSGRIFKQGLSRNNLKITTEATPEMQRDVYISEVERAGVLRSKHFFHMLKGIYPSLDTAVEMTEDNKGSVAFDREFSVDFYGVIRYKTKPVGDYSIKQDSITFLKPFAHLKEALPEKYRRIVNA